VSDLFCHFGIWVRVGLHHYTNVALVNISIEISASDKYVLAIVSVRHEQLLRNAPVRVLNSCRSVILIQLLTQQQDRLVEILRVRDTYHSHRNLFRTEIDGTRPTNSPLTLRNHDIP
jgi:hypothetical protein